jgi:hypothetical protein
MAKQKGGCKRESVERKKTQKEGGNAKKEMLINSLRSRSEFEMSLLSLLHTLALVWPLVLGLFFYIIKFKVFQYNTNIDRGFNHKNDLLEFKISNK